VQKSAKNLTQDTLILRREFRLNPEDGSDIFFRKVGKLEPDYRATVL
jgi:hypothetical protein